MSRRGKHSTRPAAQPKHSALPRSDAGVSYHPSRLRLWCFRAVVLFGVPVALFALLELSLRLVGFGYPTAFLLSHFRNGTPTLVQNNQFGWRFFGPQMARLPCA